MSDATTVIRPPLDAGQPFEIGPTLSLFDAAMVYAGRHPHHGFLKGADVDEAIVFLKAGMTNQLIGHPLSKKETRARRSNDIYCTLKRKIDGGSLKPVYTAYLPAGELDPTRTVIATSDLVALAMERGERPKYLRSMLEGPDLTRSVKKRGAPNRELAAKALAAVYGGSIPQSTDESNKVLCKKVSDWLNLNHHRAVSDPTILRAAGRRPK